MLSHFDKINLPRGWRLARFDELLERVERRTELDETASYQCVGVRWHGKGAFIRETLFGMEINRKQQWIIKAGDIVYNKLFAWKGSFAIADNSVDGCIVSDKFPTYRINPDSVDVKYLQYFFYTRELAEHAQKLSKGSADISKLTLNPPQFWDLLIPLPPPDEQRRVVQRIDAIAAKIAAARKHKEAAQAESETVMDAALAELWTELTQRASVEREKLGRLLTRSSETTTIDPAKHYQLVTVKLWGRGVVERSTVSGASLPGERRSVVRPDQFIFSRIDARNGAMGIVPQSLDGALVTNDFPTFDVDSTRISPRFLAWLTQIEPFVELCAAASEGTTNRIRLKEAAFMRIDVPLPLPDEQQRIVDHLDSLQSKVRRLQTLQEATEAELDALLPSVLEKAFRGAL